MYNLINAQTQREREREGERGRKKEGDRQADTDTNIVVWGDGERAASHAISCPIRDSSVLPIEPVAIRLTAQSCSIPSALLCAATRLRRQPVCRHK